MRKGSKTMGKCWKRAMAGVIAGMLTLQMTGILANAKLIETLTQVDGQFIRANGSPVEGALAKGITISKYQNRAGAIDWERVKGDGVSFAMVRLGYLGDLDPYFDENMRNARAHGINTGIFFYTQAMDTATAVAEAEFVLDIIKDYPVSYPVAYDVESQYLLDMGKSRQEITDQVNAFCQVIAAAGYRPIVYGNNEWLTRNMDTSQIPYDIWYSRYETSVNEYPNRTLWQYTDSGLVDGIVGEVCIDIAFTDYSQLIPSAGWRQIGGKWYYYQDHVKQTGWLLLGDAWYYLNQDGSMALGVTQVIDGVSYTFGNDGVWQP